MKYCHGKGAVGWDAQSLIRPELVGAQGGSLQWLPQHAGSLEG